MTGVSHSLASWFERRAALNRDAPALTFEAQSWSYGDMSARIQRMSAGLAVRGIGKGDRIGWFGANHSDALLMLFAASAVGAIFVPLNIRLSIEEIEYIAGNAELSLVLADAENAARIDPLSTTIKASHWIVLDAAQGWEPLDALVEPVGTHFKALELSEDDLAAIVYTSGTTGRPKGAMLTVGNLWANDLNWLTAFDIASSDVMLVVAPLFHVSGLFVLTTTTLLMGGHVVLTRGFDAGAAIALIEQHKVTTSFGVPAMMLFMSERAEFESADLSSLRLYIAGGAPVPEPLLKRYATRGIPVSQCYGASELVSATTFLETANGLAKLGSAGRAMMMAEVRLIDAEGQLVTEPNVKGEICARGGNVSVGYWANESATASTIDAAGWLRTGDVGYIDADGFLFVCDRVKDMIITGGENVYPAEVESLLFEHPAIANVAVIGLPDERWGEKVVAVAVLRQGHEFDIADLLAFCEPRMAKYKIPREILLMDELPLNASGKVVKTQLRTQFAGAAT